MNMRRIWDFLLSLSHLDLNLGQIVVSHIDPQISLQGGDGNTYTAGESWELDAILSV